MSPEKQQFGYVESAQRLVNQAGREWDQHTLRRAAAEAQLRIGGVVEPTDPVPTSQGIEERIGQGASGSEPVWVRYWAWNNDGSYYVAMVFAEDLYPPSFKSSIGHPDKPLWFDFRIWRITEILLHGATLYRALDIPADEPY